MCILIMSSQDELVCSLCMNFLVMQKKKKKEEEMNHVDKLIFLLLNQAANDKQLEFPKHRFQKRRGPALLDCEEHHRKIFKLY